MTRPNAFDEYFVHQIPELLPNVAVHHQHWRESYFFDLHDPSGVGDVIFLTFATFPARGEVDSLQLGRVGGEPVIGYLQRPAGDTPHVSALEGASIEIVEPWQEVRLHVDPAVGAIGLDATFRARTRPYGLRRGTMRAGEDVVWDQCHTLQSGTYEGSYSVNGVEHSVDGWIGQRDHSWGIRDHSRCPLWQWFQIQLDDGMLGVWHWELENGARIYTDGCWAGADGSDPVPVVDFSTDVIWTGADGGPAVYGEHGDEVTGLRGTSVFTLADGRVITVEADGAFARPYEPFQRGGLNLMRVRTDDGREGTAIYEVTGARHHRWFPGCAVPGPLPR